MERFDLAKAVLGDSVTIAGKAYRVHTSFKWWLRFWEVATSIEDGDYSKCLFMFDGERPPLDSAYMTALCDFAQLPCPLPRGNGGVEYSSDDDDDDDVDGGGDGEDDDDDGIGWDSGEESVIDFGIDAMYIYAAFMQAYHIDLIDSDMHYYKFLALLRGLKNTRMNDIIEYRLFTPSSKPAEWELQMQKIKEAWALPRKPSAKEVKALDAFNAWLE